MDGDALPPLAQLQAWRAQGLDRAAPARFDILQALAARLGTHEGEARRLLEARLAGLMRAYAEGLTRRPMPAAPAPARDSGLQGLVAALQERHDNAPALDPSPVAPSALT